MATFAPFPGVDSTFSSPPSLTMRSRIPSRPKWPVEDPGQESGLNPQPLSDTAKRSLPSENSPAMRIFVARPWRTALATSSRIIRRRACAVTSLSLLRGTLKRMRTSAAPTMGRTVARMALSRSGSSRELLFRSQIHRLSSVRHDPSMRSAVARWRAEASASTARERSAEAI